MSSMHALDYCLVKYKKILALVSMEIIQQSYTMAIEFRDEAIKLGPPAKHDGVPDLSAICHQA